MASLKAFNVLLVMVAALWLPTSPCCAMASSALADSTNSDAPPASHCPAPSPCPSQKDSPAEHAPTSDPAPCDGSEGCECSPLTQAMMNCGREAPVPAATVSASPQTLIPSFAVAAALADLYPPTFPTGRLAVGTGLPESMGAPTLLQLGCMLTT